MRRALEAAAVRFERSHINGSVKPRDTPVPLRAADIGPSSPIPAHHHTLSARSMSRACRTGGASDAETERRDRLTVQSSPTFSKGRSQNSECRCSAKLRSGISSATTRASAQRLCSACTATPRGLRAWGSCSDARRRQLSVGVNCRELRFLSQHAGDVVGDNRQAERVDDKGIGTPKRNRAVDASIEPAEWSAEVKLAEVRRSLEGRHSGMSRSVCRGLCARSWTAAVGRPPRRSTPRA